jgi:2-polyprenyl-3-methyl-5-hydroxy-6-metoxy-1,4-benzoquinol methylase
MDTRIAIDSSNEKPKTTQAVDIFHGGDSQSRTLEALAEASAYNDWMFSVFEEFIGNRVLEIGCGTGNLTRHLLEKAKEVTAIDIHAEYLRLLSRTVRVPDGHALNVRNQNFLEDMTDLAAYDTVVLINVLEHLPDPKDALRRIHQALNPSGRVVVLVPALEFLHSRFDELIGHYRRYTRKSLVRELTCAEFTIKKDRYFNLLGIAGWWWRFRFLKREYFTSRTVGLFETVTPLLRVIESAIPPPFGLSVIAVGEKQR